MRKARNLLSDFGFLYRLFLVIMEMFPKVKSAQSMEHSAESLHLFETGMFTLLQCCVHPKD